MIGFLSENGYLEGMVRGYRGSLLTSSQYAVLCHCDDLQDLWVQLATTDYADALVPSSDTGHNGASQFADVKKDTSALRERLQDKYVTQFKYLKDNAGSTCRRFLEHIQYGYMIDNVILIMAGSSSGGSSGAKSPRGGGEEPRGDPDERAAGELPAERAEELMAQCHHLGLFDALPALTVGGVSSDELRNVILQESPIGRYFEQRNFSSQHFELLRARAWKCYLEDFAKFCVRELDSSSAGLMMGLLGREAERRTLAIAINSLTATGVSKEELLPLFPNLGMFYEQGMGAKLARAEDTSQIHTIVNAHPQLSSRYAASLDPGSSLGTAGQGGTRFEEGLAAEEVDDCKTIFEYPANYAVFYAWCRLKEQEIKNIMWIAECIAQHHKESIDEYIPLW